MGSKMAHNKLVAIAVLCSALTMTAPIYGEVEQSDVPSPRRELLLMEEIPVVVVTPAKVAQPILESPSTIAVLTKEDIRRYGMTSFSDILRNVPGVDVMSVSSTGRNISMRGLNEVAASRILSLVDGRPIYVDFYGITTWELLPVSMDDIERIEVVRGPGSALYGANAFDGVVNVITNPTPAVSTRMTATVDHSGELGGSIFHRGEAGDLNYNGSGLWNKISGWDDEDEDAEENKVFNGRLQYSVDDTSTLSLWGGIQDSRGDLGTTSALAPRKHDTATNYLRMDYVRSSLISQACWRRFSGNVEFENSSSYWLESDTLDISLQHSFHLLDSNFITWGLDYRLNQVESDALDAWHSQSLLAGYVQDQLRLSESLNLTTGLRYDRHPLTGNNFSPRGSIVYSPAIGHALRASAGRAFRNPPFLYSYLSMDYEMPIPMLTQPINVEIRGNRDVAPEWVTSLELGYHGVFGARLKGSVDIFFNQINGLTDFINTETYDEDALFPGSPGGVIPAEVSVHNNRDADALGGELTADLSISQRLSARANYSYQHIVDSKTDERVRSTPMHKLNPGLCVEIGHNLLVNLFANYVGKTIWDGVELEPYILLNSVVSYRAKSIEIGLSISNLLNDRHLENPEGDEVGRSVVLSLTRPIY
ncbi:TonB-dependent receptor plug domain-containing protein [Candidatus Poribacteria bacterium]